MHISRRSAIDGTRYTVQERTAAYQAMEAEIADFKKTLLAPIDAREVEKQKEFWQDLAADLGLPADLSESLSTACSRFGRNETYGMDEETVAFATKFMAVARVLAAAYQGTDPPTWPENLFEDPYDNEIGVGE